MSHIAAARQVFVFAFSALLAEAKTFNGALDRLISYHFVHILLCIDC